MSSLGHDLLVASVPSLLTGGMAWLAGQRNHRSLGRLHRKVGDVDTENGQSLISDISDLRADMWDLAANYLEHLYSDHSQSHPALPARLSRPRRRDHSA